MSYSRFARYPFCRAVGPLLQSIVGNHALVDGNERLGWLAERQHVCDV